jgi:formylglycine-generating enzyme required for sulfatase activity
MIVAPPGRFMMGSPKDEPGRSDDEDDGNKNQVPVAMLSPLAVSKFAVTFDQWDACVAGGGCNRYRPDDNKWGRGRLPVINVSWDDAQAYVKWLSTKTGKDYRLLSEAEWEYVARAGTQTPFWWGSSISSSQANYDGRFPYGGGSAGEFRGKTVAVDSFAANPWGLYQVDGNVWEWIDDCYHKNYAGMQGAASAGGSTSWGTACETSGDGKDTLRVLRGGSWFNLPQVIRSAIRRWDRPGYRGNDVGFRVARTP